jgi:predicted CxxxxCH...CXXCH cytochrome family protein
MRSTRDAQTFPLFWTGLMAAAVVASALGGACTVPRESAGGGFHPQGFTDQNSLRFHGAALKQAGYPLASCRVCHGEDYAGGPVGSSCLGSCHTQGVEACDTCHGDDSNPLPASGAHAQHEGHCELCHDVPKDARGHLHPNAIAEVVFSGLAALNPAAGWEAGSRQCTNVYCHGGAAVPWDPPAPDLQCTGCHEAPPSSHSRWITGPPPAGCAPCHPVAPDDRHINGALDVLTLGCDACHGHGPLGAPPPSLLGEVDPTTRGAGAHRRHIDETLDDRIGAVVACKACHPVPATVADAQHLDTSMPADVVLPDGGTYNPATGTCVVSCHWDNSPGPAWTDASGAERACDACHGLPPVKTRAGTVHPSAAPDVAVCLSCHGFEPSRHADGHVDLVP